MKKLVSRMPATNRGWRSPARETTQMPLSRSREARKAMRRPSVDQRGAEAFQPAGRSGCVVRFSDGRVRSGPVRASHRVLRVVLLSVTDTVYTTHPPSGDI